MRSSSGPLIWYGILSNRMSTLEQASARIQINLLGERTCTKLLSKNMCHYLLKLITRHHAERKKIKPNKNSKEKMTEAKTYIKQSRWKICQNKTVAWQLHSWSHTEGSVSICPSNRLQVQSQQHYPYPAACPQQNTQEQLTWTEHTRTTTWLNAEDVKESIWFFFLEIHFKYVCVCVSVRGYVHMSADACRGQQDQILLELELQGCEPPNLDARNWTQDLCKNRSHC